MAVEKSKVIARIKALFPKTNLTASRLNAIADKLKEKPEDDADDAAIDEVINDFNENSIMTIDEIAKNDDRIRSLAKKAVEPEKKPAKAEPKDDTSDDKSDDPMTLMLNELKSLRSEISEIKTKGEQKSIEDRFKSDKRLEGIPASMLKGRIPKDEDSFEESIEELVSDWAEISGTVAREEEKTKLGQFSKGIPAAGSAGKKAQQVSEAEADEIAKQLV